MSSDSHSLGSPPKTSSRPQLDLQSLGLAPVAPPPWSSLSPPPGGLPSLAGTGTGFSQAISCSRSPFLSSMASPKSYSRGLQAWQQEGVWGAGHRPPHPQASQAILGARRAGRDPSHPAPSQDPRAHQCYNPVLGGSCLRCKWPACGHSRGD